MTAEPVAARDSPDDPGARGRAYGGKLISGLFGGGLGSMVVAAWGDDGAYATGLRHLHGGGRGRPAAAAAGARNRGQLGAPATARRLSARGHRWKRPSSRHGEEGRFRVRGPAPRPGPRPRPPSPDPGYPLPENAASNDADGGSKS